MVAPADAHAEEASTLATAESSHPLPAKSSILPFTLKGVFRTQLKAEPFDLVITDMTMPQLTGVDLVVELHAMQPDLPVILCTGFSEKINGERARGLGFKGLLMKPISLGSLAKGVRAALDENLK